MSTSLNELSNAIADALKEYSDETADTIDTTATEVCNESVKELKSTSPRRKSKKKRDGKYSSGSYARGWATADIITKRGNKSIKVYNKNHYHLTHLLEDGHRIMRNGVKKGDAPPIIHIDPVDKKAVQTFEERVERAIRGE